MGRIANRQSLVFSERGQLSQAILQSTWNEDYTNERQSRDSNRSATNAGSTRTKFCVFGGRCDRQRTLVIRIAAITLTSDSAITIARFRPSKMMHVGLFFHHFKGSAERLILVLFFCGFLMDASFFYPYSGVLFACGASFFLQRGKP